jgi:conjugative transposon TraN protein
MRIFLLTSFLGSLWLPLPAQQQYGPVPIIDTIAWKDSIAQAASSSSPRSFLLPISEKAVRASYPLETSYGKTTHIIFPSRIIYVDIGSDGVIADKALPSDNVLRIKANRKGFDQTTLVVITEEGKYYPFLVDYEDNPRLLNIHMAGNTEQDALYAQQMGFQRSTTPEGITLAEHTLSAEEMKDLSEKIIHRKRFIRNVGTMKMRMSFLLTGVYVYQKTLFLQITFENRSEIDYDIDFFKFFLKDRDVTKRMAYQEIEISTFNQYPAANTKVPHQGSLTLVFTMPMVTYGEDKVMEVQVYENKGGRHFRFELDSDVIIRAKSL